MNNSPPTGIGPKPETTAVPALESVLAAHPFLAGLGGSHIRLLAQNSMRMRYEPGEFIFREGDPANRFYLIESGRISLEAHRANEEEPPVPVQIIGVGDVLGWSWLFPPHYWRFDARVLEPTTALFFYGTRLREHCETDHDFGYELMKRMAGVVVNRLQATRRELIDAQAGR